MYTWEECAGNQVMINIILVGSSETRREAPIFMDEDIVRLSNKLLKFFLFLYKINNKTSIP